MSKSITESITKLFERHRVVFWYDEQEEFREEYDGLSIDGIEKIEGKNNPFKIKVTIRKKLTQKYLLYFPYEKPSHENNWLLDMELAYYVFQTDKEALYLQELEIDINQYKPLVSNHIDFFSSKDRLDKLKKRIGKEDDYSTIKYKMLSVVFGTDQVTLNAFLLAHLKSFAIDSKKNDSYLKKYNLSDFYWNEIKNVFPIDDYQQNIYEFIIEVFRSTSSLESKRKSNNEAKVFLSQWKDSTKYKDVYKQLSKKIAEALNVKEKLESLSYQKVLHEDHYELIDMKIITSLNQEILCKRIKFDAVIAQVKQRESTFWFIDYKSFYDCLIYATQIFDLVPIYSKKNSASIESGIKYYQKTLFKVDQLYRKFIWSYRASNMSEVLEKLHSKVEKVYSNDWLLKINDQWQKVIDKSKNWPVNKRNTQQSFFKTHVKPFITKNKKVFVVVSDALRYECAEELTTMIQNENRYQATIEYMIGSIPSYTQLGMASLLPRKEKITLKQNSDLILIDGISSLGIDGRNKILEANSGCKSIAIQSEKFMQMNSSSEGRNFVKSHDVIYIFSNQIDKTGDDKSSEIRVFEAIDKELQHLIDLIKKITSNNGNNILITSDHGFLYQHHEIEGSDFSEPHIKGNVWESKRRYVIGTSLESNKACISFKGIDLGIHSDVDVLIPKSINRLRVKGSGIRFVHGGATLQEVTIPLIKVSKKREDTTRKVEVDIIQNTNRITANILVVSFIQIGIVSKGTLSRHIRAGIYAEDDTLLSDIFNYEFDFSGKYQRQREFKYSFRLSSKAREQYNNQTVKLWLEEPVNGTSKWKKYDEFFFFLNISFATDFDDF
ncbi:MAG: BREX-1 system phosphatase PglZ type A [Flavobacteriaceae bacterium]|nr:BREX-1 system phosphatase PglZ type A [Flavobacteriaceae bacterium]